MIFLLVLIALARQVIDERLGLLDAPRQRLLGDRVVRAEAQPLVVQEGADLFVVDEHRDLLLGVDALEQARPSGCRASRRCRRRRSGGRAQAPRRGGRSPRRSAPGTRARPRPPRRRSWPAPAAAARRPRRSARGFDVAVLRRDDVNDRAGRELAHRRARGRSRRRPPAGSSGRRGVRRELSKSSPETTLRVVHRRDGSEKYDPRLPVKQYTPIPPVDWEVWQRIQGARKVAQGFVQGRRGLGSRKRASGPGGSSSVRTGRPRSTPSQRPERAGRRVADVAARGPAAGGGDRLGPGGGGPVVVHAGERRVDGDAPRIGVAGRRARRARASRARRAAPAPGK